MRISFGTVRRGFYSRAFMEIEAPCGLIRRLCPHKHWRQISAEFCAMEAAVNLEAGRP